MSLLAIDTTMDFDEAPPDVGPSFPPNPLEALDIGHQFWTIGDDDFEPDNTQLQDTIPPEMDQVIYDEYGEEAARAEEPAITPEEQEYLSFLRDLEYGEHTPHCLCSVLNPDPTS